ncbi:MAG: hypothetical protein IKU14_07455, partial [Rhodocyclaceae bacterium]|nr:hypothetical protein [Rhodocyclaceae bacterium]
MITVVENRCNAPPDAAARLRAGRACAVECAASSSVCGSFSIMYASRFFVSTLKEAPADAEVVSQQLMLRGGLIRRVAAGIYSWMP